MGRARGAFVGVAACGLAIAASTANCATATEIIVEVRAEPALCKNPQGIETGIAVATVDSINDEELEIFQTGCTGDQMIGKLTITPSGAKDAEVGIRIVTGVGIPAGDCHGPKWENCILARRTMRFKPREANYLAVYLSTACIGKGCGEKECDRGACVDVETIPDDGGEAVPPDASDRDRNEPDDDGGFELDAGQDACVLCSGQGRTCDGKTCNIDCDDIGCVNKALCPPQLDCVFRCPNPGQCNGTQCPGTTGACTFNCTGQGSCSNLACSRARCSVNCGDGANACSNIDLDGGNNDVKCQNDNRVVCDDIDCFGSVCTRTCGQNAAGCGPNSTCAATSNCNAWEDASVPDGG